jgi:hypothetical protein
VIIDATDAQETANTLSAMDDVVRSIVEEKGAWGSRDCEVPRAWADLDQDFAARLVALLVESAGGRVEFHSDEVAAVPAGVALLVSPTEDGLIVETRRLAKSS